MATEYDWIALCWSERGCPVDKPCKIYNKVNEPVDCPEGYNCATSWGIFDDRD